MAYDFTFTPYIKKKEVDLSFPFSYDLVKASEEKEDFKIELPAPSTMNDKKAVKDLLAEKVHEQIINKFDFNKYLNKYSKDFHSFTSLTYIIKVEVFMVTKDKKREVLNQYFIKANNFKSDYTFNLITNIEQLKEVLTTDIERIAFDTETTGLNPEVDHIVGYSFSFKDKESYYVPVKHDRKYKDMNLGKEALKILYDALIKAKRVYMFNSRFDMRMMEYTDENFDMSKVKYRDVQVSAWFADPDVRQHNLKYLEKHFLGVYRQDLVATLKNSKMDTYNTALLSPVNILFYAAQDAASTFALGEITDQYQREFRNSGEIDQRLLYPLMKMENRGIRINTDYLKEQLDYILPRLAELDELIKSQIGDINLNSPKQKSELFKKHKLDTKVKTKSKNGNMATGRKEVDAMIERMEEQGKTIPVWLTYLGERSKLEKLQSTFFGSLLEQALMNNGRVRINYRNTQAATGRLSSGADFGE